MPDLSSFLPSILIFLVAVVMLWFAFGTGTNIKRGNELLRWLQGGLPKLGHKATLRWLGSSAVELRLSLPLDPFREVTILAVMEPRDVPLLWAFARARGRRDFLIFRTSLRRAPVVELEVVDPTGWAGHKTEDDDAGWTKVDWGKGIQAAATTDDPVTLAGARQAWDRILAQSGGIWRLSVRQTVPHLEVHLRPPNTATAHADALIEALRDLGLELVRDGH